MAITVKSYIVLYTIFVIISKFQNIMDSFLDQNAMLGADLFGHSDC